MGARRLGVSQHVGPIADAILEAEALASFFMVFCCSLNYSVFLCFTSFVIFAWVSWSMFSKLSWLNIAFVI